MPAASAPDRPGAAEVLGAFLRLGLTSFGGPVAHIGYFRREFVERRRWLNEAAFADLVALCQFLPGPASSQVGFAIGLQRAGYPGAAAAWLGFTLPSALAMILVAWGAAALHGPVARGAQHGLEVAAVAIVAQAVWGMSRSLCPDRTRASLAVAAAVLALAADAAWGQIAAILAGALAGLAWCRSAAGPDGPEFPIPVSRTAAMGALAIFAALLLAVPALRMQAASPALDVFDAFYRSGALVFGGGHVVLPLLRDAVVARGWIGDDAFLAGYGAAQAVPGPLFTFAAYLGAALHAGPDAPAAGGLPGAALALAAIFLPGLLLVIGTLPFWQALRRRAAAQAGLRGVNAAVVGILIAALYRPVWTSAIHAAPDFALALAAFALLVAWRAPPLAVVVSVAAASAAVAGLG